MTTHRTVTPVLLFLIVLPSIAEDWSQWRGPERTGVLKSSPALLESIDGEELELLWEVALPTGKRVPYYSSPVSAAGRAYLHFSPVSTIPPPPPPPLPKPEQEPEPEEDILGDEEEESHGLLDAPVIKPRPPPPPPPKPAGPPVLDDVLLCVDIATGRELWRFAQRATTGKLGAPNAPCVRGGKAFFVGVGGTVYCVEAETGKETWRADSGGKSSNYSSSPVVIDDKVIVVEKKMIAFKVSDGSRAWEADVAVGHNSPAIWRKDGKAYVITGGQEITCVDASTGTVIWRTPGSETSATPVVGGDILVMMLTYANPLVYSLTLEKAESRGGFPIQPAGMGHQACTPCIAGKLLYAWDRAKAFCYDLEEQKMVWQGTSPGDGKPSPILADGKLICNSTRRVLVLDAESGNTLIAAPLKVASCTSTGLGDGNLLVNAGSHFRCYRLAKGR